MSNYESKSVAAWAFALAGLVGTAGLGVAVFQGMERSPVAIIGLVMILSACILGSFGVLTVRVTSGEVTWHFGLGPFRQSIPLDQISGIEQKRSPWYWGWGIRWTPRGWLWRAHGLDAVWLQRAGKKWVGVGTQDPDGLIRAVQSAMERAS